MTINAAFCPIALQTLFDGNGAPIVGGMLYAFDAGTTTPRTVYRDAALTSAHTNPVLTDGFGRFPPIYVGTGAYKVVVKDAAGATMFSADGLAGGVIAPDTSTSTAVIIPTGAVMAFHTADVIDGWLPLNAKTIGNASSAAAALADDTARPLYIMLWNADASLAVSGGRGVSAAADWSAGKTLTLPDYRGRVPLGRDAMGSVAAGVITASMPTNSDVTGALVGAEQVTLTSNQMPSHLHSGAIAAAGGFTPAGAISSASPHTHTGTTDTQGDHFHTSPSYAQRHTGATGATEDVFNLGSPGTTATSTVGAHAHNFTTDLGGGHGHTFTGTAVGDHSHGLTIGSAGADAAHLNLPPSVLVAWNIKL